MLFFKFFKDCWKYVDGLNTHIKTILIILVFVFSLFIKLDISLIGFKDVLASHQDRRELVLEKYTMESASKISNIIHSISESDTNCFNVILLSYHNSKRSILGYRYLYLNCISESPKNIEDNFIKLYWEELPYIYYVNEIEKIHNHGATEVYVNDKNFPMLSRQVLMSGALKGIFYPLDGVDSSIGIVVVFYKNKHYINNGKNLYLKLQKLSIILDVNEKEFKL